MNSRIKIGQAAKTLGVSIDTLRRWEKVGKLVPEKTAGGTRYYNLASLQTQFVDSVKTSPTISKSNKLVRLRSLQVTILLVLTLIIILLPIIQIVASHFFPVEKSAPISNPNVLALTSANKFLEINSDTQVNGSLSVREAINDLVIESTPSGSTFTLTSGGTSLEVTDSSTIDQDLSSGSSPAFSSINLSSSSNQLVLNSGGASGPLSWTPTVARTITLPDASGEASLLGQTISNSELANSSLTVSAGTNLSGGGSVSLGGSVTLNLKDDVTLSGTLTVSSTTKFNGVSYAWPSSQGSSDTVLSNNGSGTLSWGTLSSAAGWTDA